MKVQSSVNPSKFYVRKVELGDAHIRLRKNIKEVVDEEKNVNYEFDEVEVNITDRGNLNEYIENNFDDLFQMGLELEAKIESPSDKERIEDLEDALMELTAMMGGLI